MRTEQREPTVHKFTASVGLGVLPLVAALALTGCGKREKAADEYAAATPKAALQVATATDDWGPKWSADGQLTLPVGFERWIYLGSPLTPQGLNGEAAPFPEYHNVYIQPEAYDHYVKTGSFAEGTIMFKELQLTQERQFPDGSRIESSGRGYFPGARGGVDVSVKDSTRCAATNNWCYFNFGHHAPPYELAAVAKPAEECAACHQANAATDMVFTQFYQRLQKE